MEELLAEEGHDLIELGRGDVIEGIVVGREGQSLIVDVGAKSEGIVTPNEMHSLTPEQRDSLKVGDGVLVYVLQPDSEESQLAVSIDRARGEQGWRELQTRFEEAVTFEATVSGFNKGGLLVNVEGVNAFVPLSQVMGAAPETDSSGGNLNEFVGRPLRLKVIEINRRRNRVILSERAAMQEWRAEQKDRLLAELREGEIRRGRITSIRSFGVFVDLGGADGLVHLSELSWERDVNPEEVFSVGVDVDVYVMKIDQETKKIGLSIRRARPEQWDDVVAGYEIGQVVVGQVTKLVTFGAFVRIDGPVEGLIHVSELVDRRISHPREVVDENQVLPVKIVRIERDRHRLGLSLRQSRVEAERDGWIFNEDGGIAWIPPATAEAFEIEQGEAPPPAPEPQAEEQAGGAALRAAEPVEKPQTAMEAALERAGLSESDLVAGEAPAAEAPAAEAAAPVAPASETPAAEAPAAETPAGETPAADPPAAEFPAAETPAGETPAADPPAAEAPAAETPASEAPADEAPADEAPADEAPADEAPADEAPADEAPADEAPADEAPADEAPADEAPADEAPADEAPADEAPADEAPADET